MGLDYIRLGDGDAFQFAKPTFNMTVDGLAKTLSQLNRFTGHTLKPYSVAQHCVIVSRYLDFDAHASMRGLLHDAHEALIGDLSAPLKRSLPPEVRKHFAELADVIDRDIFMHFDCPTLLAHEYSDAVHRADLIACATELRDLMPSQPQDFAHLPTPHHAKLKAWPAWKAAAEYVKRFGVLRERLGI